MGNPRRKKHLLNLIQETGIDILTYDSLINWYIKDTNGWYRNIAKLERNRYSIKRMDAKIQEYFAYLGPGDLKLSSEQRQKLIDLDYQIVDWEKGLSLSINHKYSTIEQLVERNLI